MKKLKFANFKDLLVSHLTPAKLFQGVSHLGHECRLLLRSSAEAAFFILKCVVSCFSYPWYPRQIYHQLVRIGYESLPIVALTSFCIGAVMIIQLYGVSNDTVKVDDGTIIAAVVMSVTREFGAVVCGLMVAGRMSSAIATEIGSMKVSEQIDAMTTLATDPFRYLVAPRLLASIVAVPLLVIVADIIGIFGSFTIGVTKLGMGADLILTEIIDEITLYDIGAGLTKGAVFGIIIAIVGCYQGFHAVRSTEGVGVATTKSVVLSFVLILVFNYIITDFIFYGV